MKLTDFPVEIIYIIMENMMLPELVNFILSVDFFTNSMFKILLMTIRVSLWFPASVLKDYAFKSAMSMGIRILICFVNYLPCLPPIGHRKGACYFKWNLTIAESNVLARIFKGPIRLYDIDIFYSTILDPPGLGFRDNHHESKGYHPCTCNYCKVKRRWRDNYNMCVDSKKGYSAENIVISRLKQRLPCYTNFHFEGIDKFWEFDRTKTYLKDFRYQNDFIDPHMLVGAPETVVVIRDDVPSPLNCSPSKQNPQSTISPDDSVSCVMAENQRRQEFRSHDSSTMAKESVSFMADWKAEMASLKSDVQSMKSPGKIGDYQMYEYDMDLELALRDSGVFKHKGESFIEKAPCTKSCDLVPQLTTDKRLNFLIRLHTALFKLIPDSTEYPPTGVVRLLSKFCDGKFKADHPSFDLLQIVLTDSLDLRHGMVKSNSFLLPVLEQGMRINERIVAICLKSLRLEYEIRWNSLVKDCILPDLILDNSKWSDEVSQRSDKLITSRRPDLARKHTREEVKSYKRSSGSARTMVSSWLN